MILQLYRKDGTVMNTINCTGINDAKRMVHGQDVNRATLYGKGGIKIATYMKDRGWRNMTRHREKKPSVWWALSVSLLIGSIAGLIVYLGG